MSSYGLNELGTIVEAIKADAAFIATLPNAADWVELPYGVGVGWTYDGSDFTGPNGESPPTDPSTLPQYRYLLTGPEWVSTFTDAEWAWIKEERRVDPSTNASKALDKMMDAIRWTNSVDVSSSTMDPFYTWLLNNGIPGGQTRIDELRAGITE